MSALLFLILELIQWIRQRQLQDETRNISVLVFAASYISGLAVYTINNLWHARWYTQEIISRAQYRLNTWGYFNNRDKTTHYPAWHYSDVIMDTMASEIASLTIVYSSVYSGADQRKHQSSATLAFLTGEFPHKWSVTREMFPFDDVIIRSPNPHYSWEYFSYILSV